MRMCVLLKSPACRSSSVGRFGVTQNTEHVERLPLLYKVGQGNIESVVQYYDPAIFSFAR